MIRRYLRCAVCAVAFSLPEASHSRVVGFREPLREATMGVRGMVLSGTLITGAQFYSNDATVFPEVLLAADTGNEAAPQPATVLRSVQLVAGASGYVRVSFPPYAVENTAYVWLIIRLPDDTPLRDVGPGGGPGLGLRAEGRGLFLERSIYTGSGGQGELGHSGQFDISILTNRTEPLKPQPEDSPASPPLSTWVRRAGSQTIIGFHLGRSAHAVVEVYDIRGRRVARLLDRVLEPGTREMLWPWPTERQPASGIYLYRIRAGDELRSGKILYVR